jgi:menaquinone-specific isochorismate synthase
MKAERRGSMRELTQALLSGERRGLLRGPELGTDHARWTLAEAVGRRLSEAAAEPVGLADERVVRVEARAERVDPFAWLRAQRSAPKLYWSGRDGGERAFEVAAVGIADVVEGDGVPDPAALRKRFAPFADDPRIRYYGGLRFDPRGEADGDWAAFGGYRFSLPRFEMLVEDGISKLVCNLVLPWDADRTEEILDEIEDLSFEEGPAGVLSGPVSRTDSPGWPGWKRNIERALAAFDEGWLGKVVLARRVDLEFEEELAPTLLAESLKAATPGCFHFYVEPEEGVAFVGASPERLFRREGREVRSEAVAGTRPRGESESADAELRDQLLGSAKDLSEHAYVRDSIREGLGGLCEHLEVEEQLSEMKLARGRHLVSGVRGTLREGVSDWDVLEALHPTPAVGGHPKGEALTEIRASEPFDRGWYAGPVGWVSGDAAEFAVGIRSGLVSGRTLQLFSGAGIVAGSVPGEEWAEIEQKIGDFTRILSVEPGNTPR